METDTPTMKVAASNTHAPAPENTGLADHPAMRTLSLAARMLLAIVFLIAGAEKIGALNTFADSIAAYGMLPSGVENVVALAFVWTEIVVGVLLFAGAAIRGAALVTGAMLVMFLVAIISAIARGLEIDCGCFAGNPEPVGLKKVLEDTGLLAAAIFLIYFPRSYFSIGEYLRRDRTAR